MEQHKKRKTGRVLLSFGLIETILLACKATGLGVKNHDLPLVGQVLSVALEEMMMTANIPVKHYFTYNYTILPYLAIIIFLIIYYAYAMKKCGFKQAALSYLTVMLLLTGCATVPKGPSSLEEILKTISLDSVLEVIYDEANGSIVISDYLDIPTGTQHINNPTYSVDASLIRQLDDFFGIKTYNQNDLAYKYGVLYEVPNASDGWNNDTTLYYSYNNKNVMDKLGAITHESTDVKVQPIIKVLKQTYPDVDVSALTNKQLQDLVLVSYHNLVDATLSSMDIDAANISRGEFAKLLYRTFNYASDYAVKDAYTTLTTISPEFDRLMLPGGNQANKDAPISYLEAVISIVNMYEAYYGEVVPKASYVPSVDTATGTLIAGGETGALQLDYSKDKAAQYTDLVGAINHGLNSVQVASYLDKAIELGLVPEVIMSMNNKLETRITLLEYVELVRNLGDGTLKSYHSPSRPGASIGTGSVTIPGTSDTSDWDEVKDTEESSSTSTTPSVTTKPSQPATPPGAVPNENANQGTTEDKQVISSGASSSTHVQQSQTQTQSQNNSAKVEEVKQAIASENTSLLNGVQALVTSGTVSVSERGVVTVRRDANSLPMSLKVQDGTLYLNFVDGWTTVDEIESILSRPQDHADGYTELIQYCLDNAGTYGGLLPKIMEDKDLNAVAIADNGGTMGFVFQCEGESANYKQLDNALKYWFPRLG